MEKRNIMFDCFFWRYSQPLTKAQKKEAEEYDRKLRLQERRAITYAKIWSDKKMRDYIFKQVLDSDDNKDDIEQWIEEKGLKYCFEMMYKLFGEE